MRFKYETDSREIKNGQTFVAIKGHTCDGHEYIEEAIRKGASDVVVNENTDKEIVFPELIPCKVADTREYLKKAMVRNYADYFNGLKIIGVTGTNGKTTTCHLTYELLKVLKSRPAYIGTLGYKSYLSDDKIIKTNNTTPDILTTYKLLSQAIADDCNCVVMEVSSHALAEERIAGLHLNMIGYTGLTQDHLDFHGNMENYLRTKTRILDYLDDKGKVIINYDDEHKDSFIKDDVLTAPMGIGYNREALFRINTVGEDDNKRLDCDYSLGKTVINFNEEVFHERQITTNLTGEVNVYNYLMAYAFLREMGYSYETINF